MKQVIPFYKEIVFKNNIASIINVSLEHEENVLEGEISGNFILTGEYKIHNDTTEVETFKYKLPFTALISDDMNKDTINKDTINIDIENFSYEQIEDDVLRIDIDFSIGYEEIVEDDYERIEREIDEILGNNTDEEIFDSSGDLEILDDVTEREDMVVPLIVEDAGVKLEIPGADVIEDVKNEMTEEPEETVITEIKEEGIVKEEYVTYYVYVVKENDTLEQILKTYNVSLDYLKEYNEIKDIKLGDKIIIPLYDE